MHIKRPSWTSKNGQTYRSAWLCKSRRVGKKTVTEYVLNLKGWAEEDIDALDFALKNASKIHQMTSLDSLEVTQGKSVGAVWALREVARNLGIERALGDDFQAQLAMWQIIARLIGQGSRLSAVRLHQTHAMAQVLQFTRGFDENDLYDNLAWLCEHQASIEDALFHADPSQIAPDLLLYDVTSSYLEGDKNALGAYGYNRDGKRGKKQIVVGLLCDVHGQPLSVQVYKGNTCDLNTFADQVQKTVERFGCQRVTFVGDRGMIKTAQREALDEVGFQYITGLTKAQIESLLADKTITMELFDETVCEVHDQDKRYILRRNPVRAQECAAHREDKLSHLMHCVEQKNRYLEQHPKAHVDKAYTCIHAKIEKLHIQGWLSVKTNDRTLVLEIDEQKRDEAAKLDGCYVLITNCAAEHMDAATIHARYKDLAQVERAFRSSKTGHLELRPVYVRTEPSTRGHVFVIMLAYRIRLELERAWRAIDCTVEEGIRSLDMLCYHEIKTENGAPIDIVPQPNPLNRKLLKALNISAPPPLPRRKAVKVGTHKKVRNTTN